MHFWELHIKVYASDTHNISYAHRQKRITYLLFATLINVFM